MFQQQVARCIEARSKSSRSAMVRVIAGNETPMRGDDGFPIRLR